MRNLKPGLSQPQSFLGNFLTGFESRLLYDISLDPFRRLFVVSDFPSKTNHNNNNNKQGFRHKAMGLKCPALGVLN